MRPPRSVAELPSSRKNQDGETWLSGGGFVLGNLLAVLFRGFGLSKTRWLC